MEGGSCRNIKSRTFSECHFPFGVTATLLPPSVFFVVVVIIGRLLLSPNALKKKRLDGNPAYRHPLCFEEVLQRERLVIIIIYLF